MNKSPMRSAKELCTMLGVSGQVFNRLVASGIVPPPDSFAGKNCKVRYWELNKANVWMSKVPKLRVVNRKNSRMFLDKKGELQCLPIK